MERWIESSQLSFSTETYRKESSIVVATQMNKIVGYFNVIDSEKESYNKKMGKVVPLESPYRKQHHIN